MEKLHIKFSALNVDFDGPSLDFPGSRKPAHEGIKNGRDPHLGKSRHFTVVRPSQYFVNIVADLHRHAAYHNKHQRRAF